MKKKLLRTLNLSVVMLFITVGAYAQTYNMKTGTITICGGNFHDPAGSAASSTGGVNDTMTFVAGNSTDHIRFVFNSFVTVFYKSSWVLGELTIYDGPNTSSRLIGVYSKTNSPGTFISTGNSITFVYKPGATASDWDASISCVPSAQMSYLSSTVIQTNFGTVIPASINQQVIGIEVTSIDTLSSLIATSFSFNTKGSTKYSDITNAKLWFTGTSNVFATTTLFGSVTSPADSFVITGSQALQKGPYYVTNYFWLTYDIAKDAIVTDVVDAECTKMVMNGKEQVPLITTVAGTRPIEYTAAMSGTWNICSGHFYDPAGSGNSSSGGSNDTVTICSNSPTDHVRFVFNSFETYFYKTSWGLAELSIYDGPNTSSPLLGTYSLTNSPGTITSTGTCITFAYKSGRPGSDWDATVSCVPFSNMKYASSKVIQTQFSDVTPSSTNQQIIGIAVNSIDTVSTLLATSFNFNTKGTTNYGDIANAKLWFTGTSSTFTTTTLFGSVTSPADSFVITGSQALQKDLFHTTNYFWLTYDLTKDAVVENEVDAECTKIKMNGVSETPTITSVVGSRKIVYTMAMHGTWNLCSGHFYDPAGTTASTGGGANDTMTICSNSATDHIRLVFNSFLAGRYKSYPVSTLNIYDGPSVSSPLIGSYTAGSPSPGTVTSRGTCLTLVLQRGSLNGAINWDATISCVPIRSMKYTSSIVTQTDFSHVLPGSTNQHIIGIAVNSTDTDSTLLATAFHFSTKGSSNFKDIANAKLWFTGTSNSFATTTLFGSVAFPTDSFVITGSQALQKGFFHTTNYFWLTYDLANDAFFENVVDAECKKIELNGVSETPKNTGVAGARKIIYTIAMHGTWNICSGHFYDSAGLVSSTGGGANDTMTICSNNPTDHIRLTFNNFIARSYKSNPVSTLYIYDGPNISSPLIGAYTVGSPSPGTVTATGTCLTMVLKRGSLTGNIDWDATISSVSTTGATIPVKVGGATKFCLGDSVVLTVDTAATSYLWSNGATTKSIVVKDAGSYVVRIDGNCISSVPVIVTVLSPVIPIVTQNADTLTSTTAFAYQWYKDNSIISGATSKTYIKTSAAGVYTVKTTDTNGCSSMSLPSAAYTINTGGTITSCNGHFYDSGDSLGDYSNNENKTINLCSASSDPLRLVFNSFSLDNADTMFIYDGTTSSATLIGAYTGTISPGTIAATGSCLMIRFISDTSGVAAGWDATFVGIANITTSGTTSFCQGNSVVLTSNSGSSYLWSDGKTTVGTTMSYTATSSGNYTVEVTNSCGAKTTSLPKSVTVFPLPATPVITANKNVLTSSAVSGNQWFKNGVMITGATSQTYVTNGDGTYSIKVTDANSCSSSMSSDYTVVGISEQSLVNNITIYPNPGDGKFFVSFPVEQLHTIAIYDVLGELIWNKNYSASTNALIDISGHSTGIYFYKISSGDNIIYTGKLVVQ